jgi:hypothetical protein
MERLEMSYFIFAAGSLAKLSEPRFATSNERISDDLRTEHLRIFTELVAKCDSLGLSLSSNSAARMLKGFLDPNATWSYISTLRRSPTAEPIDETWARQFLAVDSDKARLYSNPTCLELMWQELFRPRLLILRKPGSAWH